MRFITSFSLAVTIRVLKYFHDDFKGEFKTKPGLIIPMEHFGYTLEWLKGFQQYFKNEAK